MKKWWVLILLVGVFLSVFFAWKIGKNRGYSEGVNSIKRDTLFIVDTHFVEKPVEVIKWKDREKLVFVPVTDTLNLHDTTFVVLPREFKVYEDSTYTAQVSGVEPSLDWIKVYQRTEIINNVVKERPRAELSLFAEGELPLGARAGLRWDREIFGGMDYYLETGYDYNIKWYMKGGIKIILKTE